MGKKSSSSKVSIKKIGGYSDNSAVASNAKEYEDDFKNIYSLSNGHVQIIEPPYNPNQLEKMSAHNNALAPCIDAMITNIDGTGYEITFSDDMEDEEAKTFLEDFFREPWPGVSFTTIRKKLREDQEKVGYACLEVVRDATGAIVLARHVEAKTMRLVALDDAQVVPVSFKRQGKDYVLSFPMRYRRFAQKINNHLTYFKEFGCPIDVELETGKWITDGKVKSKGTEIVFFKNKSDVSTPYGVPRWIPQIPSVLGSRGAEEHNLSFFDGGGIPPFMIIVHGGVLAPRAQQAIEKGLNSKGVRHRGFVVEAESSTGTMNESGAVKVTVERFGSERQNDSMFENYDANCEKRIRRSFRLAPLFVGQAADYSYATAFASYVVTEAQVFKPERDEFDEIINLKLIPALLNGKRNAVYRSLPITVHDVEHKLTALQLASSKQAISRTELLKVLNEIVGLDMKEITPEELGQLLDEKMQSFNAMAGQNFIQSNKPSNTPSKPPSKKLEENSAVTLAKDILQLIAEGEYGDEFQHNIKLANSLSSSQFSIFKDALVSGLYEDYEGDKTAMTVFASLFSMKNNGNLNG